MSNHQLSDICIEIMILFVWFRLVRKKAGTRIEYRPFFIPLIEPFAVVIFELRLGLFLQSRFLMKRI